MDMVIICTLTILNVQSLDVQPPVAGFTIDPDNPCNNQPILFSNTSTGELNTYTWSFGSGAVPASASGEGPHEVTYPLVGGDKKCSIDRY